MKVLTSHKSLGITFKTDFRKILFIIIRNKTVLVYTFVAVNEGFLYFVTKSVSK